MNIQEKAAKIVEEAQVITLASIEENGYPRPVAVMKLKDLGGALYVSTGTSSAKTAHFRANPKAGVSIVCGNDSIVYTGKIEIVKDKEIKQSLWCDWMFPHFPGGVDDPEYCVLKFTPESYTYWIDGVFYKNGKYMNRFCQSCGMSMYTDDQLGTNKDGSENQDYCLYCYQKGSFTEECTMDEMIEHCVKFLAEFNNESNTKLTQKDAIAQMKAYFPNLKRWKDNN